MTVGVGPAECKAEPNAPGHRAVTPGERGLREDGPGSGQGIKTGEDGTGHKRPGMLGNAREGRVGSVPDSEALETAGTGTFMLFRLADVAAQLLFQFSQERLHFALRTLGLQADPAIG